jgi:hypothetical protein
MNRKVAVIPVTIGVLLALYPVAKLATAQPKARASLLFVQMAQKIDYKKSDSQSGVMTLTRRRKRCSSRIVPTAS